MLDQFAGVVGQDFAVMFCPFRPLDVESVLFGSVDDCGHGNLLAIGVRQSIFYEAIVVAAHGISLILDDSFIDGQFFDNGLLGLLQDMARRFFTLILDRKGCWIFSVSL